MQLPAVDALLHNSSVAELLHDYIGGPVRYDGHVTLRLSDGISPDNYVSGTWHHDRCGRRLKLFIFLHDVTRDTRPTQVAQKTANTIYFSNAEPWKLMSRYNNSYVQSTFKVVDLVGPAGGGFILDTNALHRGITEGRLSRTTVILEFHGHAKLPRAFSARSFPNACPSVKRGRTSWQIGEPGYPLYPQDSMKRARSRIQDNRTAGMASMANLSLLPHVSAKRARSRIQHNRTARASSKSHAPLVQWTSTTQPKRFDILEA